MHTMGKWGLNSFQSYQNLPLIWCLSVLIVPTKAIFKQMPLIVNILLKSHKNQKVTRVLFLKKGDGSGAARAVERSFAWANAYRRLTRSYEKTTPAEETFFQLAFLDMNLAKI